MKSFLAACIAIVLIAYGSHYALERAGFSSAERTADRESVRLD